MSMAGPRPGVGGRPPAKGCPCNDPLVERAERTFFRDPSFSAHLSADGQQLFVRGVETLRFIRTSDVRPPSEVAFPTLGVDLALPAPPTGARASADARMPELDPIATRMLALIQLKARRTAQEAGRDGRPPRLGGSKAPASAPARAQRHRLAALAR
jgi:hypothetical protein